MIPEKVLFQYGAEEKSYEKNEIIFSEGGRADYFYQIRNGETKMFNLNEDGKEFVQGIFGDGKSFGEPPIFGDFLYPATAKATKISWVVRLVKPKFLKLLKEYPAIHLRLTQVLCDRLHYKSMIMKEVSVYPPEHRILTLLTYLKTESNTASRYEVKLTRQQISELTGLRVETVIRTIKKLETEKKLKIINRKIHF